MYLRQRPLHALLNLLVNSAHSRAPIEIAVTEESPDRLTDL